MNQFLIYVVVGAHLAFIVVVVAGGLAAAWRRWLAAVHLPLAAYGVLMELVGWSCPLTTLERRLRASGGLPTYSGGFIDHYLAEPLLGHALTTSMETALGLGVLLLTVLVYSWVFSRPRRGRGSIQ